MIIRTGSDVILELRDDRLEEPRLLYSSDLMATVDPRQPLRKILLCARCWVRMSDSPRELIHCCPRCRWVVSDCQLAQSRDPTLDGRVRWVHCNERLAEELRTRPLYRPTPSEIDVQTVYWPICVCGAILRLDARRERVACPRRHTSIPVEALRFAFSYGATFSWLDRGPALEGLLGFRMFDVFHLVRFHAGLEGGPWIRSDFELFGVVDNRGANRRLTNISVAHAEEAAGVAPGDSFPAVPVDVARRIAHPNCPSSLLEGVPRAAALAALDNASAHDELNDDERAILDDYACRMRQREIDGALQHAEARLQGGCQRDELEAQPMRQPPGGLDRHSGSGDPIGPALAPRLELVPSRPRDPSAGLGTSPPVTRDQRLEHLFSQIDDVTAGAGHDLEDDEAQP